MPEDLKTRAQREMAEQQKALQETGPYMTLGIQLVLTILAFFGIGYWLDHHFKTGSLWTAIFAGFGAFSSLTYFVVTVMRLQKQDEVRTLKKETKSS
jgi:F0F1-type ATP synthase assembly protein I